MTISTLAVDADILRLAGVAADLYELHANGNSLGITSDIVATPARIALDAVESAMEQLYDAAGEVATTTGSTIANEIGAGNWRQQPEPMNKALRAAEERCARTRKVIAEYAGLRAMLTVIAREVGVLTTEDAIAAATPGPVDMTFEEAVGS